MRRRSEIEFTDRYDALGIKCPSQLRGCRGGCEATGWIPIYRRPADVDAKCSLTEEETEPRLIWLWEEAERVAIADDGWHFVKCPDCKGAGIRDEWWIPLVRLPRLLKRKASFARHHLFSAYSWRRDVPHWRRFNIKLVLRILFRSW